MQTPSITKARVRNKDQVKTISYKPLNEIQANLGKNKLCYVKTYGCQMNEHDTENIKAILETMNYTQTENMKEADLILLNTCAIRENVHDKVYGLLGHIKPLKENKKKSILVGLCGCMAQEENVVNTILDKYKWIDFVFGTHNIYNLPNILEKAYQEKIIEVISCQGDLIEDIPVKRNSTTSAFVNIMYGCDKFCAYCIVPYTRGKQRSRDYKKIIEEVEQLKLEGYKEVTLLGQNVNAFGKDLNSEYNMANLLEDVAKTNIERIKFVTSHPWDFKDEMIDVMQKYTNIIPFVHLPLQAGSNKILKSMGRMYTKESYINLFQKIKEKIPNCSITTDIIVGFPNETEQDFNQTLEVVNICKFDSAYTFLFSKREGTPAAKMEDNITLEEKNKRLYKLNEIINQYANENNQKFQDKIVSVLVEEQNPKVEGQLKGHSENMKLVNFYGDNKLIGQIVKVKIKEVKTFSMLGELID